MNRLEEESNKEENEYLCQLDNFLVHNHFFILKSLKNTKRKKKSKIHYNLYSLGLDSPSTMIMRLMRLNILA